jgi:hypothetical protein
MMALLMCSAPALALVPYFDGFEDPGWVPDTNWPGDRYEWGERETHSAASIPASKSGSTAHYRLDSSHDGYVFHALGGYTQWGDTHQDWYCSVDVWIDLDDPQIGTGAWWMELDLAQNKGTGHYRDFMFHLLDDPNTDTVVAWLDGNGYIGRWPPNADDVRTKEYYAEMTETGWYTFSWVTTDIGGQIQVETFVDDQKVSSDTNAAWVTTGPQPYGGQRYHAVWSYPEDYVVRLDNLTTAEYVIPEPASLVLLGLGGLMLLRRRR